jgi:hypothetical protein
MEYTREYRKKIFETLPPDLKEAIISTESADKLQEISSKHSLMLDQAGELGDAVGLFMLGLTRQSDFVNNVAKRLEISLPKALEISKDVDAGILDAVRSSLQEIQKNSVDSATVVQPTPSKPLTPLEKAGDFEIIKDRPVSASPQYNDKNLNKAQILDGIENPPTTQRVSIVDHLLANPVSSTNTTTTQIPKAEPTPPQKSVVQATPAPTSPKSADPYREPIE